VLLLTKANGDSAFALLLLLLLLLLRCVALLC
jgi:hypothetical protein